MCIADQVDKSAASGERLKEAMSINKSLSAIGDVICALASNQQHVPYRNHPLTMLLSDSIGGTAKSVMFVNCSPADCHVSESVNSLTFATRCKHVKQKEELPTTHMAAQLAQLKAELARVRASPLKAHASTPSKLSRPASAASAGSGGPPPCPPQHRDFNGPH